MLLLVIQTARPPHHESCNSSQASDLFPGPKRALGQPATPSWLYPLMQVTSTTPTPLPDGMCQVLWLGGPPAPAEGGAGPRSHLRYLGVRDDGMGWVLLLVLSAQFLGFYSFVPAQAPKRHPRGKQDKAVGPSACFLIIMSRCAAVKCLHSYPFIVVSRLTHASRLNGNQKRVGGEEEDEPNKHFVMRVGRG